MAVVALAIGFRAPATGQEPDQAAPVTVQPMRLGPPTLLVPRDQPTSDQPVHSPAVRRANVTPTREVQGIEINPLAEINPESIGILDMDSGGFGRTMWRGSSRSAIERLLPRLPGNINSANMRSLAHRLLLSSAAPPRQRVAGEAEGAVNLLTVRVDRLAALGDVEGLNDLLRVVPQRHDDERIARARVEGLLLGGDPARACQTVRSEIAEHHGAPYWRKAMVFCQMLSGELDQAMLGVGLMREQGLSDDPAFFSLIDAYAGAEVSQLAVASPLHLAMLEAVGRPFPSDLIEKASPGLLVALARSSGAVPEQRAQAAEKAVGLGVLEPEKVARLYAELPFTAEQLDNAIVTAEELEGARGRALLYQAARHAELHSLRAEILRVALDNARNAGLYHMAVGVLLPLLSTVPVRPELVWFAETAGRALYGAGRYEQAGEWFTLARQEAILNPQAAAAVAVLWPYSRLADSPALAWEGDLSAWRAARGDSSAAERDRQALLRGAFMALGERDSLSWIDLVPDSEAPAGFAAESGISSQPLPDAALLYALAEASEMRRLGETVLLVLLVLGEEGPAHSHPMALNAALSGLMRAGLQQEARALAIEAAIAKGV
jgi:tetratricopeptide (TPR) repeat protein